MKITNDITHIRIPGCSTLVRLVATIVAAFAFCTGANALPVELYADTSRLATGRWYKVSVPQSGVYSLKAATLRRMGFSDPSKVRVFGYGARRIGDELNRANYTDDLPQAPMAREADGTIVFFAQGPETWSAASYGRYTASLNIYTNVAYYYVSDACGGEIDEMAETGVPGVASGTNPASTFNERLHYEKDVATPGEAGAQLVGDDFRFTPSRSFTFSMPGRVEDTPVWMETSFVARTLNAGSRLEFTINGIKQAEQSTDYISGSTGDEHIHGTEGLSRRLLESISGNSLKIDLRHVRSSTVYGAWLNYISVNYERNLTLADDRSGALLFHTTRQDLSLGGADDKVRVWDVTDERNPLRVNFNLNNNRAQWTAVSGGERRYVAFGNGATLPEPTLVGQVANQNLHGHAGVNMVIITPSAWKQQAERIAAIRRAEGLTVRVLTPEEIYNEFSSGSADIGGLRRYLKMLYDRGGDDSATRLRYCLLMARGTYDNRHNTREMAKAAPTLPAWYGSSMREALSDTDGFGTDDFLAMLEDGSGLNKGMDHLSIAVGRIPTTSEASARNYVDKLVEYDRQRPMTGWENQVLMLVDDQDNGEHMTQADHMERYMMQVDGQPMMVNKVYLDTYDMQNGVYPRARDDMFRYLNSGSAWWTYIGHANNHSLSHEGQLTYNDINNNMLFKHVPIFYAATCNFLRWDSNTESGGEILFNERYGGTIATISATRPVWIYENGLLSRAMGRWLGSRDVNGEVNTLGEIYRLAKNDIRDAKEKPISSSNRLRYVLMGDPSMKLPTPSLQMRLDSINGVWVDPDGISEPATVMALRPSIFAGSVIDNAGNVLTDFNGTVTATLYDADKTVLSKGNGEEGVQLPIDMHGSKLFAGSAKVEKGRFSMRVVVPAEIENNYRTATFNMYATADVTVSGPDSIAGRRAVGVNRMLYVYGVDETSLPDTLPPVIETMYLNTSDFTDGAMVNTSPMLISRISDDNGINLNEDGLSGRMVAILDGNHRYTNLSQYFTPSTDGSPSGIVNYPLSDLQPGPHELTLRVSDSHNNMSERTISFNVGQNVQVQTFRLYCDANPASVSANFYIEHDRPDQRLNVTVTVYDLMGREQWSGSVTGVSDMQRSTPVTWNLTDKSGRRVPRGIYLYRATVSEPGGEPCDSGTKRIAVTD